MNKGVSIVICCYNSSKLLPETIRYISNLRIPSGYSCELIIVDNNSDDSTSVTAEEIIKKHIRNNISYKILYQPVQGLSAARKMGIDNSEYEFILFCDDDNWLSENYIEILTNVMESNCNIGVLGGESTAVSDVNFPEWFQEFRNSYSAGIQSESNGNITWTTGALWGAGMAVRKKALMELFTKGFAPFLSDRKKKSLTSGGDIELCFALRLAGWEIWYESSLKIKHFIPQQRLNWNYLRKLSRGFGAQKVNLDPYLKAFDKISNVGAKKKEDKWQYQAYKFIRKLRGYGFKKLMKFNEMNEGNAEILRIEKTLGRLTEILKIRGEYDRRISAVNNAPWRKVFHLNNS